MTLARGYAMARHRLALVQFVLILVSSFSHKNPLNAKEYRKKNKKKTSKYNRKEKFESFHFSRF